MGLSCAGPRSSNYWICATTNLPMSVVRFGIYLTRPLARAFIIRRSIFCAARRSCEVIDCLAASFLIRCTGFCYVCSSQMTLNTKIKRDAKYWNYTHEIVIQLRSLYKAVKFHSCEVVYSSKNSLRTSRLPCSTRSCCTSSALR